ncbi:MAG: DUF86 domain-containing protein [Bacillota bacterium]|nr:DUF86 domain-containing protein [Bacillota bacterium]
MQINHDIIMTRLKRLENCIIKLKKIAQANSKQEFIKNDDLQDIAERNLQLAAQCCIDIGNHIISKQKISFPEGYADIFSKLYEAGIIDEATKQKMSNIAGFRNILVHDYLKVSYEIVYDNLQDLDVFINFARQINNFITNN